MDATDGAGHCRGPSPLRVALDQTPTNSPAAATIPAMYLHPTPPQPPASAPPGRRASLPERTSLVGLVVAATLCFLLALPGGALAAMDYAKQVLIGADFHGADLRGVTFNLTNLRDADLHDADLRDASLFGAKLQDANLSGTDLRGATLDSAILQGTDLRNARLDDAFAFNTRFLDVLIEGADFSGVPLRGDALKSLCAVASGTNPVSGKETRDTLGC